MAHGRRTRIFIVDDSAVMRSLLRTVISADPSLEVAGTAADGAAALQAIESVCPDLVLLDVEMPNVDGLETLRRLRSRGFSHACGHGQRSHPARRPRHHRGPRQRRIGLCYEARRPIRSRVCSSHACAGPASKDPGPHRCSRRAGRLHSACATEQPRVNSGSRAMPSVVVIGVSTGGPAALDVLLSAIPARFPLPILIVQHMPELFTGPLAERLNQRCSIPVREAVGRSTRASQGPFTWRVATGTWKFFAAASAALPPALHLHQGPLENHCRPAVDVLFRSAAARLRRGNAGCGAHGNGLRRPCRMPRHSRPGRHCPRAGSGHQRRLGHAAGGDAGRSCATRSSLSSIAHEILLLARRARREKGQCFANWRFNHDRPSRCRLLLPPRACLSTFQKCAGTLA